MLLAMLAAVSVAAPGTPAASAAAPAKAKSELADTICWVEAPVGSHVPHRYCAPRFYWEQRQRQDQQGLHPFGKGGGGGGGGGGLGQSGPGGSGGGPGG